VGVRGVDEGGCVGMVFQKARGWILGSVFSIVGTTVAVQFGLLGPGQAFLNNLLCVSVIWVVSRVLAWVISRY
jgi:hypothetical protein